MGTGCSPTCTQACDKLFDECGVRYPDGYGQEDCVDDCQYQRDRYERIEGEDLLLPHLQCVLDSTCEELNPDAEGTDDVRCFDDEVYVFPG